MLRAILIALFLAIVANGVLVQSQRPSPTPGIKGQPPQAQSDQTDKNTETNQRGTENAPRIVKIVPPPQAQQEASAKHQSEVNKPSAEDKIADYTKLLFIATVVLAAIAFIQLLVFGYQGRQLRQTAKAIVENERPWVGPITVCSNKLVSGQPIVAGIVIINSGKSPAQQMRVSFDGQILQKGRTPSIPASDNPEKSLFPNINDFYHPFHGHILTAQEYNDLYTGSALAWMTMRIDYLDGTGKSHYTNICTRWDRLRDVFVPAGNNDAT